MINRIEISVSDNFREMSEDVALSIVSNLVSKDASNLDYMLKLISASMGEEIANSMKDQLIELINKNISGMKSFVTDLTEYIANNKGKKFIIKIEESDDKEK